MSSFSQAAVTSPVNSMTATPSSTRRTRVCSLMVVTADPLWSSSRTGGHVPQGARLVVVDVDELGQPCDLEDLPVVVCQPVRSQLPAVPPRPGEQAHQQGDA